jgi:hypothetical protein
MDPKDNTTLGEGRGDCGNAISSSRFGTFSGNYTRVPSLGERLWKKMIGKPYSGKPNIRFDEGELEIEHLATTPVPYSNGVLSGPLNPIFSISPSLNPPV